MSRVSPAWLVVSLLGLARCSLAGFDDFALAACTDSAQCEPINVSRRIAADACMRYQCDTQAQRCVLRVRDGDADGDPPPTCGGHDCDDRSPTVFGGATPARERCDGVDNNCNGIIDEGAIVPRAAGEVVTALPSLDGVGYGRGNNGRVGLTYQSAGQASFAVLQGGAAAMPLTLSHAANASDNLQMPNTVDGCRWRRSGASAETVETCSFGDLAVDSALNDADWFALSINRVGCTAGQVRLGYVPVGTERQAALVLRGPAARSNVYLGVDRDPAMGECTGASRAMGPRGATRPALATLQRPAPAVPQALAVWLGDSAARPDCGGTAINVEALGMWLESATSGGALVKWVNATSGGLPQALGQTRGGARPSVTAWSDRGYFVGYGAAEGGVALHFVPTFSDPPAFDPAGTTTRLTSPLTLGAPARVAPAAPADGVAVSIGAIRATGLELGVAWQQGCGAAGSSVWFARVRFMAGTPGVFVADPPVEVSTGSAASAPTIAYVSSGFVVPGLTRGGMAATAETDGGWVVAYTDTAGGSRVLARRVSELDASLVAEPAIDLTHRPTAMMPVSPSRPMLYSAAMPGLLRYAYHDTARNSLVGAELLCAPGATSP